MNVDSRGTFNKQVAVVAKYDFYFDDISSNFIDLDIKVVSARELSEVQERVKNGAYFDYILFPHFSNVIPTSFLETQNCIGFHTGDLPKDRGGSPIQNKILKGEYFTWVNAFRINSGLDAGAILCREEISLEKGSIDAMLREISKVVASLARIIVTENPIPVAQSGRPSFFSRIKSSSSELKMRDLTPKQIYDRIRMLDGLDYPSAFIRIGRYRILLSNAELHDGILTFDSQLKEEI